MENVPIYASALFALLTFLTVFLFYKASGNDRKTLFILLGWLAIQTKISLSGFYQVTGTIPPRIILIGLPAVLFIAGLFITAKGRAYVDQLDLKKLTLLHTIRVAVEFVLLWLFIYKAIPQRMTFEGYNFDILAGLTAPLIYYFVFVKMIFSRRFLLVWNIACLCLLINIIIQAIFSTPTVFQQFAFDQPNIAILYFPFVWLPCCVVPLVFLSHLAAIRQLTSNE
ncbi:MAG: hypothetical protein WAT91_05180 [Saprospiraceae bacterium]